MKSESQYAASPIAVLEATPPPFLAGIADMISPKLSASPLPPGMAFPGGLQAMVSFVEEQIGNAERQLHNMTQSVVELSDLGINLNDAPHSPVTGSDALWNKDSSGQPVVYGNTQTGYRADLRTGADVRKVMNCHQCKTNKRTEEIVFCGHISIDAKGYSTTCTKRYCRTCLWNWYMEQAPKNDPENEPMWSIWRCPSCRKLCCCHRCRTFTKQQRGLDTTDLHEQAGALSPARCLARALGTAGFPTIDDKGLCETTSPELEDSSEISLSDSSKSDSEPKSKRKSKKPKRKRKRNSKKPHRKPIIKPASLLKSRKIHKCES